MKKEKVYFIQPMSYFHHLSGQQLINRFMHSKIAKHTLKNETDKNKFEQFILNRKRNQNGLNDKENNTLLENDMISVNLHSGPFDIVHVARILSISNQIDDTFDVVYLSFGNWSWDMEKVFKQLNINSITAVHFDEKANIEANIWKTPELPKKLQILRENCLGITKLGET